MVLYIGPRDKRPTEAVIQAFEDAANDLHIDVRDASYFR